MHVRNKKCIKVLVRIPAGKGPPVRHACRWVVKVKLSQDIPRRHKGGCGGIALLILNLSTTWEWSDLGSGASLDVSDKSSFASAEICTSLPAHGQVSIVTVLFHIDWNIIYISVNEMRWEVWIGFVGVMIGMVGGLR
jgi:hypothetical protein